VNREVFLTAFGASTALFGFIVWLYCAIETDLYPQYQTFPISYYVPIPQNLAGDLALPIAYFGFCLFLYEWYVGKVNIAVKTQG
jgi:hypothetical protein